jgi:hypothetical protein
MEFVIVIVIAIVIVIVIVCLTAQIVTVMVIPVGRTAALDLRACACFRASGSLISRLEDRRATLNTVAASKNTR